ncbi:carbon-nitrogen hydrolase family protein [Archaeoglobus neptunius]|uniref:carbon-nitrogen hydrolase family protein n=1 Tax=Archaeoglobus neptunius TaxID=2798580 RepID=UPI001925DFA6|nr:carbon-nitrogen hydrolase family protein [Archaeoglobus neptunius]
MRNRIGVAAVQCRIGDLDSASRVAEIAVENGAEILLFPEYFSYATLSLETLEETLKFLKSISSEFGVVASGNGVVDDGGYRNRSYLYDDGELVGWQDKIHPTRVERQLGILSGTKLEVFEVRDVRISTLVCADILYPELCRVAALKGVEIVLNPVVSFKRSELPGTEYRYCLYFTRSFDNAYAIVKAGGFGRTFTGSEAVGRSLISTFDGIIAKYKNEQDEEAVVGDVELDRIREYKEINYSLTDRNVKAYEDLLS